MNRKTKTTTKPLAVGDRVHVTQSGGGHGDTVYEICAIGGAHGRCDCQIREIAGSDGLLYAPQPWFLSMLVPAVRS